MLALASGALFLTPVQRAVACGGLFCSLANPVEQAAERILFVDNGDGTTSAVIEIQYQGPSERFAWVLPMPGTPEIRVASNAVFDALQLRTQPRYELEVETRGECEEPYYGDGDSGDGDGGDFAADAGISDHGVVVLASGETGPYTYTVLSVVDADADPAKVAVDWLTDNQYDVTGIGTDVLRPYLADGLNLVAVKLTKGNNAGAIRPLWLKYDGDKPTIPIRPTAVAARPDMGILIWLVSEHRGVPINFLDLHLNEAYIDWLTGASNYDWVVSRAADEAGGQGFVTEYAGSTDRAEDLIWQRKPWEQLLQRVQNGDLGAAAFLQEAADLMRFYNGFRDVVERQVKTTEGLDVQEFFRCPNCFDDDPRVQIDLGALVEDLDASVAQPAFAAADLVSSRPYMTRLYTTMSPAEMTHDPIFDFNPDLPEVDNQHLAKQVVFCNPKVSYQEARWQITLESGAVVHGMGFRWPVFNADELPLNQLIRRQGTSGQGMVMTDNTAAIVRYLAEHAPVIDMGPEAGKPNAGPGGGKPNAGSDADDAGTGDGDGPTVSAEHATVSCGGCSASPRAGAAATAPWLLAMALLWRRRRA